MQIKETFPELYRIRRRPLSIEGVRSRLTNKRGREFWQSLEELASSEEFEELLHREFPQHASEWDEGTDRRTFLKLMGASLALAGLAGCSYQPPETVVPYVRQPEEIVPGKALYFATAIYNFAAADRVLALDSNFLECGPGALRYARDFASRRRTSDGDERETSRLYAVETTPTNTGFFADNRLAVRPSEFNAVVSAIAAGVGAAASSPLTFAGAAAQFVEAVVADLKAHAGSSIVIAGDEQGPEIHALAHQMNAALGNTGKTVNFFEPVEEYPVDQMQDLRSLIGEIDAGTVDMLVIIGGNPVFTTPADLKLDEARMKKGPFTVHLSLYEDETSELCQWHIPEAHYLEAWGDTRAFDGTVTITQPLIAPLYNGKSACELLAAFTDQPDRRGYDIVRSYWLVQGRPWLMSAATANAAAGTNAAGGTDTATGGANSAGVGASSAGATAAAVTGNNATSPTTAGVSNSTTGTNAGGANEGTRGQASSARAAQAGVAPTGGGRASGANQHGTSQTRASTAQTGASAAAATPEFERAWRKALNDGFVQNTARLTKPITIGTGGSQQNGAAQQTTVAPPPPVGPNGERPYELVFRTDPTIYDGRFANNGWLQELPKPLTKLTWDNVAVISSATAERLGVGEAPDGAVAWDSPKRVNRITAKGGEIRAEVLRLTFRGRTVKKGPTTDEPQPVPVFILPGQPDDVITVHLGYGRWRSGRVGGNEHDKTVQGFNAYDLRTTDAMWSGGGLGVEKTPDVYPLASTQS